MRKNEPRAKVDCMEWTAEQSGEEEWTMDDKQQNWANTEFASD